MGELIKGAYIEITAELAEVPFVLGRDLLGDVLNGPDETMTDITHEVVDWDHRRWSDDPYGPLTRTRAGRAYVRLYDPSRRYDPTVASGGRITFGARLELRIDGEPVLLGRVEGVRHSYMPRITLLIVDDGVQRLQRTSLQLGDPLADPVEPALDAGTTFAQVAAIADALDLDASEQVFYGPPAAERLAVDADTSLAWEWLESVMRAELGDLWIDRYGRLAVRGRHVTPDATIRATIGAGGIACDGLFVMHERRALVTGVNLTMADGERRSLVDSASEAEHGTRRIGASESELLLDG